MANQLFIPSQVARAALARRRFMSVLPRTVRHDFAPECTGGRGTVINVKGPVTVSEARTYTAANRANRDAIVFDDLAQANYPVEMSDEVYKGVRIPDDFATFDLSDANSEIVAPMAESVHRGITNPLHTAMLGITGVTATTTVPLLLADGSNAVAVLNRLGRVLSAREVPMTQRYVAVGSGIAEAMRNSNQLRTEMASIGDDTMLRQAEVGRVSNFIFIEEPLLPAYYGVAYVRDAFAHVTRAPALPSGAADTFEVNTGTVAGAAVAANGFAVRWLKQYNPTQLEDQAIMSAFVGARILDADRAVSFGLKVATANIVVTPDALSLAAGASSAPLVVTDENGDVIPNRLIAWTTANAARCTVDADGVVTGVGAGSAVNVTATYDGKTDTCAVTVTS